MAALVDGEHLGAVVAAASDQARRYLREAGVSDKTSARLVDVRPASVSALREQASELKSLEAITVHEIGGEGYPTRLYDLDEPPGFVFAAGGLRSVRQRRRPWTLAVVGSRKIPAETRDWVSALVAGCAEAGITVVSGGALGADAMAHRAAMQAGMPTVSVMPCGVDAPKPKTNSPMFRKIVRAGGALVSEYPPGTGVRSYHYPRRNRLIAALGDATLVLRAGEESGTMLTARAAQAIDRPIGAVPGRPGDSLVAGCHSLLAEDGRPVTSVSDVTDGLLDCSETTEGASEAAEEQPVQLDTPSLSGRPLWPDELSQTANGLLARLVDEVDGKQTKASIDELAKRLEVTAAQMQSAVLEWELADLVSRPAGGSDMVVKFPRRDP
jgi:DNA processing protein